MDIDDRDVGEQHLELYSTVPMTDCSYNQNSDEEGQEFDVFQLFEKPPQDMIVAVNVQVINKVNEEYVIENIGYSIDYVELIDNTQSRYDSIICEMKKKFC